jgi:hypothetical protein
MPRIAPDRIERNIRRHLGIGKTGICGTVNADAKASMERHISVITLYFR